MGYPVGVLIWVVVKINDQTVSADFGSPKTFQLVHQFTIYATVAFNKKTGHFLWFSICLWRYKIRLCLKIWECLHFLILSFTRKLLKIKKCHNEKKIIWPRNIQFLKHIKTCVWIKEKYRGVFRTLLRVWEGAFLYSWRLNAVDNFCKILHLRCLTGFYSFQ